MIARRTLWSGTALACAAIVVGGTPSLRGAAVSAAVVAGSRLDWSLWVPAVLFGLGATACTVVAADRWLRRRDDRSLAVRRLARRGHDVAAIARSTDLAQDAVRDLLEAVPEDPATSAGAPGNFFRGRARGERPGRGGAARSRDASAMNA